MDDPIRSHITQNAVPMSHGLLNDYGTVVTIRSVANFDVLLTVHLSIFISVIDQLDAQKFCFTISLFHDSTCFELYVLIIRRSKLYYTVSGIITTKQVSGLKLQNTIL